MKEFGKHELRKEITFRIWLHFRRKNLDHRSLVEAVQETARRAATGMRRFQGEFRLKTIQ